MRLIVMLAMGLSLSGCAASPPKPATQTAAPIPAPASAPVSHPTVTLPDFLAPLESPAALDPKHPLRIGQEYYPMDSRIHGEEGTCLLRLQVDSEGYIRATQLLSSTGFPRLNAACLSSSIDGRLIPATAHGKRRVHFGQWMDTPIFRRGDLKPGMTITGPAIIEQSDTTTVVEPRMKVRVDRFQNVIVEAA